MSAFLEERVLSVHHWTDRLFSFTTTRDRALRFSNGHFTMIGLPGVGEQKRVMRAYSIASANYEEHLEFLSIKVPGGAFTERLQNIRPGDTVVVGRKPTGTLLIDHLLPGRRLYLLATGTGLAPFLSVVRDPATYERFEKVVLVHGVRHVRDLAYCDYLAGELPRHELLGEFVRRQFVYYPAVTREPFRHQGRITHLIESGTLFRDLSVPALGAEADRVMICGGPAMLRDLKTVCEQHRMREGSSSRPGEFVIERAFVES